MSVLDDRGRVFGRVNLVDAAVAAFLLVLIPLAYGTWLLFRPAKVEIASVTQVTVSKEERRIANPLRAFAKLKVRGRGFTPMLRAWIGSEPSLGFVFEDPNSADVIVGPLPPGTYDLLLFDGGLEVARAPKAVVLPAVQTRDRIKAVGRLIDLDRAVAEALQPGATMTDATGAQVQIAALGPVQPSRSPLVANVDVARADVFERAAALVLPCDPTDLPGTTCTVGGAYASINAPLRVPGVAAPMTLMVEELLPSTLAQPLDVTVRWPGGREFEPRIGDRDALLDDRAAVVTAVEPRQGATSALTVRLRLGADQSHDGWRYRGRLLKPGLGFTVTTDRYIASVALLSSAMPADAGAVAR